MRVNRNGPERRGEETATAKVFCYLEPRIRTEAKVAATRAGVPMSTWIAALIARELQSKEK